MVTSIQCEGDHIQNITIKLKYDACCTMHRKLVLIRLMRLIENPRTLRMIDNLGRSLDQESYGPYHIIWAI